VNDHAHRTQESWDRRRVDRVLHGLKGLPDAIRVTWPDATVQTCVVHLVRNSFRFHRLAQLVGKNTVRGARR